MTHWFYYVSKFVLWLLFRLGFGLEVHGQEHVPRRGAFLLASNHLSYLDPPVLGAACPRRLNFMARSTLFALPLLGLFMRGVHVIPLQRDTGDLGAIREAVRRLRHGEAIAMFPEGGRQLSGKLGTAKRGVGLIAVSAGVPIVPVVVQGTFEALPTHARRLHRAKIRVAFGPQIPYTAPPAPSRVSGATQAVPGDAVTVAHAHHDAVAARVTSEWHRLTQQLTHG